ncbi:MAG: calcium-translocating P-type ATPase, PMCA-type [Clostridiales bacterium]|nr:calcium-translocating P-type ATPase, PMCA-type [Clostridiales bacterium]
MKEQFYNLSAKDAVKKLATDEKHGLTQKEAQKRQQKYGKNILNTKRKKSIVSKFIAQFNDFMILLLLGAAGVSFFTSFLQGDADIAEPVIILAIVTLNALLGVIQESRAEKSLEALKKLASPHASVIRDGQEISIESSALCPGDIVSFSSGDIICADCRLLSSTGLCIDESALTGESVPVQKDANSTFDAPVPLGDRKCMVYSSTAVVSGKGRAVVCATGMNTEVGEIAAMLINDEDAPTPLQQKLSDAGKNLGIAALAICVVIFVIGLFKRIAPLEMFMTSVSLAVAAIPEGLPAIVTIMLAIGVMKLSAKNAVIRHLPSVETLGSASVICTDKTGTLTQNKMRTAAMYTHDNLMLLRLCALCSSDANNPTDAAILAKALEEGIDTEMLEKKHPLIDEEPFTSVRKRVSVIRRYSAGFRVIVKGAPEYILPLCTMVYNGTRAVPISKGVKDKITAENNSMTKRALRVIAVAYCDTSSRSLDEKNLTFAGLIGLEDPPRLEAAEAVKTCKKAGIIPVMVTGDHIGTAVSVAKQTGILTDEKAMTGTELDALSDSELCRVIGDYRVFARVTPAHKVRIVKAWQSEGHIVAMTGDGVNDAPALSAADIGCSMGKKGTDVAKNASDMILTDDNFATIVKAVHIGRGIYDNIRKAIKFLLSSNIGEILTVFSGIVFGCGAPLSAIELLWVNLVTDSLPAIALGLDPYDRDVMEKPPRPAKSGLFGGGLWGSIIAEGLMIGALALLAFSIGANVFSDFVTGQTMAFAVLSISQLVHSFNMRSEKSVIRAGLFKNKYLVLSFIAGLILQVSVISVPAAASLFGVARLDFIQWCIVAGLSLMPLVLVELQKLFSAKFHKKSF